MIQASPDWRWIDCECYALAQPGDVNYRGAGGATAIIKHTQRERGGVGKACRKNASAMRIQKLAFMDEKNYRLHLKLRAFWDKLQLLRVELLSSDENG